MRAAYYERTGPAAEVLVLGELPAPVPQPGEVLVRVAASGINPADVKRRAGWQGMAMAHPRIVPHCDGAGTIEAVGPGVSDARIGERVWLWNAQGGYGEVGRALGTASELISIASAQAVTLPAFYGLSEGACLGVPALTAHRCVMADGSVAGLTVLVRGGAGAVGSIAVQIARCGGARVLATAGTEAAAARVAGLGAEPILRHEEDVAERVLAITGEPQVDRIIEVDFAANAASDAALLRPNGTLASYSSSSDPKPTLDYYGFAGKGLNLRFIQGFALPPAARAEAERFIATQPLKIDIAAALPLERIAEAHEMVEAGGSAGQVVLRV